MVVGFNVPLDTFSDNFMGRTTQSSVIVLKDNG